MPSRIIREGILDSERIGQLSINAELFYRKLMSVVDDYGRYEYVPSVLRARLYSQRLDSVSTDDINSWIQECSSGDRPLVIVYHVHGKRFLEVQDFNQQIKAKASKFPAREDTSVHGRTRIDTDGHSRASSPSPITSPIPDGGVGGTENPRPQEVSRLPGTEGWEDLTIEAVRAGMVFDPDPAGDLCQKTWRWLDMADKMAAVQGIGPRIENGQFGQPRYTPSLRSYLEKKLWRETLRPRDSPRLVPQQEPTKLRSKTLAEML